MSTTSLIKYLYYFTVMETAANVERVAAASSQVPQEADTNANDLKSLIFVEQNSSKALEKQELQAPQEPVYPSTEFWEQLLSTLGQIKSNTGQINSNIGQINTNIGQIKSNTDQMVKLMTDGHGGDNEESENLHDQI
ncbi:unnamed protein product [Thlaspi arvense]|uniref:Uncharacterized protein n=1 Tax=Thlaspi arvense TaxID=13288 RepID=A0AAU9RL81_THLAR|nr:unnamed protein product [Thlaspi arvense]